MSSVTFTIIGPIRGKARIRSRGRQFFKDAKTRRAETSIAWEAKRAMVGRPMLEGALELHAIIEVAYPKNWSKAKRAKCTHVIGKPDADNVAKLIADSLNGILYEDDRQISDLHIVRRYADRSQATVTVRELDAAWIVRRNTAKVVA